MANLAYNHDRNKCTLHEMYSNKHGRDMHMNVLNVYMEKKACDSEQWNINMVKHGTK